MTSGAGRSALYVWLVALLVLCAVGTGGLFWLGFPWAGPPAVQSSASMPAGQDVARLVLAEQAGGLTLLGGADAELAARAEAMMRAGIELRDMISGRYGPSVEEGEQATFYGGVLAVPIPEQELDARAVPILDDIFRVNFPNLHEGGLPSREYDPGTLGGHLRCRSYPDVSRYACGWVDQFTVGYTFGLAESEQAAAAQLVALRADVERVP
jgi:hypothetical protein